MSTGDILARKVDMTSTYAEPPGEVSAPAGVYAPQSDSQLLIAAMHETGVVAGRRVADLCTGSGVVAISAAAAGAASVSAFDTSLRAVRCARANVIAAGVDVGVHHGTWSLAAEFGRFDVVLCNPPYVPQPPGGDLCPIGSHAGPVAAYNAGADGRLVLDPLCAKAPDLLGSDGTLLLVHSEFSDVDATLALLRHAGLKAAVIARQRVPFGPVLTARASWLEDVGRLEPGRREEELLVVRADVP